MTKPLNYLSGFGNYFQSEAKANIIKPGQNSPQHVPYGLYAEQLSGSAFTAARSHNLHSWLYRILPSVKHEEFSLSATQPMLGAPFTHDYTPPNQMRWDPLPYPKHATDFIHGLFTLCGHGAINTQQGAAIHLYAMNKNMEQCFFYNADGDMLFVLQEGNLRFKTEFGIIEAIPTEIVVIPRGIKFQIDLLQDKARGYICENYGAPFRLPELGVIGANGLANPRDFKIPVAAFEQSDSEYTLYCKFQGQLWQTQIDHSPCNVVAWHGNYVPYKYDLTLFNTINSVSFDHPDPSIFTVLTSPTTEPGTANVDFVIFPPRWMVARDTFRPPYFHRNVMSEYMGLIQGTYDAKKSGFIPGGGSLHNSFSAHGPDAATYSNAVTTTLTPEYYENTLAFMFEAKHVWRLTKAAYVADFRQKNYLNCWQDLAVQFEVK